MFEAGCYEDSLALNSLHGSRTEIRFAWNDVSRNDEIVKLNALTSCALNSSAFRMGLRIRTERLDLIFIVFGLVLGRLTIK